MISILRTANELDRLEELKNAAIECYSLAVRSVSQYTIEIDPHLMGDFRQHLEALEHRWLEAIDPAALRAVQDSLRGEVREYRDRAAERLSRLRKELEAAAAAMATFADDVASNSGDCENRVKGELKSLEQVARSNSLDVMRGGIRNAVSQIAAGIDQMRRTDRLVIVQLQDEIRVLHREFQAERRALFTDPVSGAWTRQKLDLRMHELLRRDDGFCAIAIAARNLHKLSQDYSRNVIERGLKAMLQRFRAMAGEDAPIGRWNDDEFVMILEVESGAANEIAIEIEKRLGGPYAVQENGIAHKITIELAAATVERTPGADPANFLRRLERLTESMMRQESKNSGVSMKVRASRGPSEL